MAMSSRKLKNIKSPPGMVIKPEWTFRDRAVAQGFDAHVREQLPWYELATGAVAHIARCYLPDKGLIIDVGASTGNIGRALKPTIHARCADLVGIEASREMADLYDAPGDLRVVDAREFDFAAAAPDVIVCFLALMFVPVADRLALVERMAASLRPGGALIVFDKTMPRPGYLGTVLYRLTLAAKHEAGAPAEEVIAKELSISGVQRPMADHELASFVEVFRFGDFAGFVREAPAA